MGTASRSKGRLPPPQLSLSHGLLRFRHGLRHGALLLRFIQGHGWHRLPSALLSLRLLHPATAAHSLRAAQDHAQQSRLD